MSIRHTLLLAALATLPAALFAQDQLAKPQLSPAMQLTHTLGLTEIELNYSAPSVRGRSIFGGKIPFDVVWRAGANATTKITFSTDVEVQGVHLAAGSYGLHLRPGKDTWSAFFNSQADAWGSYSYDPALDVVVVDVTPREAAHREQMRYAFDNVTADSATLVMHWDATEVPVHIAVDTTAVALQPVRDAAASNDQNPGWQFWSEAAELGRGHGVANAELMDWIDRSIAKQRTFINQWARLELLDDADRHEEAEADRADVLHQASVDDLQNYAYRYHKRGDYTMSAKFFGVVVNAGASQWWPHSMLGQAKREIGDTDGAIAAFRGALECNPDRVTRSELEANIATLEGSSE